MIRETGADEDDDVDLNKLSSGELKELKRQASDWCDDNGI